MKKTRLLRLFCAVLGIITLLSAMPIFAEETTTESEASTLLNATIDFETGKVVKFVNGGSDNYAITKEQAEAGDVSKKFNTSDIAVFTPTDFGQGFHCFIQATPTISNNWALQVASGKSFFAVKDINRKLPDGDFTVSADFYLDFDQGTSKPNFQGTVPLIRWSRNPNLSGSDSHTSNIYTFVSVNASNRQLVVGPETLNNITVSNKTWYNVTVEAKYINEDNYEISLYLNNAFIAKYTQSMPEVSDEASSYLIFFSNNSNVRCTLSYLDNIRIYEWITEKEEPEEEPEEIPGENLPVDTTINFENVTTTTALPFLSGTADKERCTDISSMVNTVNTAVRFPVDFGSTMHASVKTSPTDSNNKVLRVESGSSYLAVKDVYNRLVDRDFVASADISLASIPTNRLALISWVVGTGLGSSNTKTAYELVQLSANGQLEADGKELGVYLNTNEWFNVTVRAKALGESKYEIAIYLNEKLVYTYEKAVVAPSSATNENNYIRFLNITGGIKYSYLDNVQVYETVAGDAYIEKDILWDVNFNSIASGTTMDAAAWRSVSNGYGVVRCNMNQNLTVENGELKISGATTGRMLDLNLGGGGYSPLKDGSASFSFKFRLDTFDKNANNLFRLIRWRRVKALPEESNGASADILSFRGSNWVFCGITLPEQIVADKVYNVKVVINGAQYLADLYLNDVKVVDSAPISETITGENTSYFLDDMGNKYYTPYTGFISSQVYNANGEPVTGKFVRRLVENACYGPDQLRLFQSSATSDGIVFYVDDLKVERVDTDKFIDLDFTGWSSYADNVPKTNKQDGVYVADAPKISTEENGNEYLQAEYPSNSRIYLGDQKQQLIHKPMAIELDVMVTKISASDFPADKDKLGFLNLNTSETITSDPYNYGGFASFLQFDANGNLYGRSNIDLGAQLSKNWTNIRMEFESNGTKWTDVSYYVNGVFAGKTAVGLSTAKDFVVRILPQNVSTMGWDNIKMYALTEVAPGLELDFSGDYAEQLAKTVYGFPAIGSLITNSQGNAIDSAGRENVVQVEVLTEGENGFLRVNHTKLNSNTKGYLAVENDKVIGLDEYLIETSFRYDCEVGFGVKLATLISENYEGTFTPVGVKGASNALYATIRGVNYDLYTSHGKLLTASTTKDNSFTDVAILVNESNLTYTVYVNDRMAYYYYDGAYLPCTELPIIYKSTGYVTDASSQIKLLEIDEIKSNDCVLDIGTVTVKALPSGISSELKATQSRINTEDSSYDIRFIAGTDTLFGNAVGCTVEALYGDKVIYKEVSGTSVFSSIIADDVIVNADVLSTNYLFFITVEDIPQTVTEITFNVTTFIEHGGVRVASKVDTVYATYADGIVTVK